MSTISPHIDAFAGGVLVAGDHGWDPARQTFNVTVDQSPAMIALPADAADVAAAVRHASAQGLKVAPQATGHNAIPLGDLSEAMLVRTDRMRGVTIDPEAQRARAEAGAVWSQVIPAASELGLAALHGSSHSVGVVGYSLGGGLGWLARKHGLQANAVTAIELVTADGELVRADADTEPDLFWALRGGGGNFGVVTAIEFELLPLAQLYAGALFFPLERAGDLVHSWNGLRPGFPEELMTWIQIMNFPPFPEVPEPVRGRSFAILLGAFLGSEADGRELLQPLRGLGPEMDTFATVPPVALSELAMDPPEPLPYLSAHQLLGGLPAAAIDELVEVAGAGSGSTLPLVQLRDMGGALGQAQPGAGARATLDGDVAMFAVGMAIDDDVAADSTARLAAVEGALAGNEVGHYWNFREETVDAASFFDAETWERLRRVRARYDPGELMLSNHRIPPAA